MSLFDFFLPAESTSIPPNGVSKDENEDSAHPYIRAR